MDAPTNPNPARRPLPLRAITRMPNATDAAVAATEIAGIETNLAYLRQLVAEEAFARGAMTTRALETFSYTPRTLEVLSGGTQTTIQDYPGRLGYWNVGVPPSGPMDVFAFRLANGLVGNPDSPLEVPGRVLIGS